LRKRVVQLPYVDHDEEYAVRVLAKFKDAENTTLYILDRFDGSSAVVARLLANSGFKGAYAIKGGAEGNKGWKVCTFFPSTVCISLCQSTKRILQYVLCM
jgi:hypothetical protein